MANNRCFHAGISGVWSLTFPDHPASPSAALWSEDAYVLAVIVALTLIAVPMLCLAALFIVWWRRMDRHGRRRWHAILAPMWQWMMLDVFGLALLVFLTEGDSLVKTDVKPGVVVHRL